MKMRTNEKAARLSRRDFNKLTVAAFGGVLLGTTLTGRAADKDDHDPKLLLEEPHVCRGLNTCKEKGKGKNNACAGQGNCATADKHSCKGENACKGQGGCGEYPGQNSCKGKGGCEVPLAEKKWAKARKAFEEQMTKAGKKFGDAPKKKA